MAFTFDSTAGGTTTNSYATVANLDDYVASFLFLDTFTESNDEKEKLLVMAFRIIDSLDYSGAKTAQTQAAMFPRLGLVDREGYAIAGSTIPQPLKDAQMELAVYLWQSGMRSFGEGDDSAQISSYDAGSVKLTYQKMHNPDNLPKRVQDLLKNIGPSAWLHKRSQVQLRA